MKIVLLESLSVSKECMKKYTDMLVQEGHSFQCYERNDDPEVQIQEIGDADIVMIANMPLSGKVISACPNLKFIEWIMWICRRLKKKGSLSAMLPDIQMNLWQSLYLA